MMLEAISHGALIRRAFQIFFVMLALVNAGAAFADPAVFWGSDPVEPDETVLLVGDGFDQVGALEIAQLPDNADAASLPTRTARVQPIHLSPTSVKFTVPSKFSSGVYRVAFGPSDQIKLDLNVPSIYWSQGDLGSASSPGGWVRVLGRNIARNSRAVLRLRPGDQSGKPVDLHTSTGTLWDAGFVLPADLPLGSYSLELWNGNGDASSWRSIGVWRVVGKPAALLHQVNVADFGARGDGVQDDSSAVASALRALTAQGGGTLWFPRGYYRLTDALVLPPGIHLKGEDRALVRLIWPDFPNPPYALIQGSSEFSVENVTIIASNHAHVISGGFSPGSNAGLPGAKDISIRRVTVRASMYKGHLTPEQVATRLQAALKFSTGGPDTLRLSGKNLTVEDCDLYGSGRSLYLQRPQAAYVAGNKFYNGRWGWYSISGADGVIFENNQVIGSDLQSTGGGINTLGNEMFAQNVAFLHNRFEMMNGWDREAMTSDGPGGCYYGGAVSNDQDRRIVGLPEQIGGGTTDLSKCVGAGLFVLGGKGAGQVRRIEAVEGQQVRLQNPFAVPLDGSSVVTMTTLQRHYLVIGNDFADAGIAVQLFGASVEDVIAENTSRRTGGFLNRGLQYGQFQPTWYNQFLKNTITEGDLSKDAVIATWGSQKSPNRMPLSLGTIIRSNVLEGGAHIEIKGFVKDAPGVRDVVVEKNRIQEAGPGIVVDEGAVGVFLRDNLIGSGAPASSQRSPQR